MWLDISHSIQQCMVTKWMNSGEALPDSAGGNPEPSLDEGKVSRKVQRTASEASTITWPRASTSLLG